MPSFIQTNNNCRGIGVSCLIASPSLILFYKLLLFFQARHKPNLPAIALVLLVPKYGIVGAALSIAYNNYTNAYAVFGFIIYLIPHYSRVWTLVDLPLS
ncbi:MAG: hypothetical protein ACE5J3_09965 [Methanosarcinales archaeon]